MKTLGIDLASQPRKTAACVVHWLPDKASVKTVEAGVTDNHLLKLVHQVDKVGIDVPFGWPTAFIMAVTAHHASKPWTMPVDGNLRLRRTDLFVHRKTKKWPLSVSADKIAMPALRAAALMCRLPDAGSSVDRTGDGKYVEVYPAAALLRWQLLGTTKDGPNFLGLLDQHAPWLELSNDVRELCTRNRDARDSLVASLVARASALGRCEPIPVEERSMAKVEGWIALPMTGSLQLLLDS